MGSIIPYIQQTTMVLVVTAAGKNIEFDRASRTCHAQIAEADFYKNSGRKRSVDVFII